MYTHNFKSCDHIIMHSVCIHKTNMYQYNNRAILESKWHWRRGEYNLHLFWRCRWLLLKNFSAILSWWEQVTFRWDGDVHFTPGILDQHNKLDFYSASWLKQLSMGGHVLPLRHIIMTLSRSVFVLTPKATCLGEAQQISIL